MQAALAKQIALYRSSARTADRYLYLFIFLHLCCWTLAPALIRYNLPLDSIEGTIWGSQLDWGYDKNPFLNGWLTGLAIYLGGQSGWMVYLFSQLFVVASFWAVWKIAKYMLPPAYAVISVMLLEGIQYYNFHAIDFNDNTIELGLWALTSYFFYRCLRTPNLRWWLCTGLFAGLSMMAKYYSLALLTAMFLFLVINKKNRKQLTTAAPYLGLTVFFIIILPHLIWLCFHDYITIRYVFMRASSIPHWFNHIFFPAEFAFQQGEAFIPALLLSGLLFLGKKPHLANPKFGVSSFDKSFLFFVGLGPFLLTILLSMLFGNKLRAGWGMPLQSLWGIMLIASLQPHLTLQKIRRFMVGTFLFMGALILAYINSLVDAKTPSSANFPGREIAQVITQEWHDHYHSKLAYVAGSRWVSGNISLHSLDHPAVFIEWNTRVAPWINTRDLKEKGAVFVWSISENESMPLEVLTRYPQIKHISERQFNWRRNKHHLKPVRIGIALLPPENST